MKDKSFTNNILMLVAIAIIILIQAEHNKKIKDLEKIVYNTPASAVDVENK